MTYPQIRESMSPDLVQALAPQTDAGNNWESLTPNLGLAASDVNPDYRKMADGRDHASLDSYLICA